MQRLEREVEWIEATRALAGETVPHLQVLQREASLAEVVQARDALAELVDRSMGGPPSRRLQRSHELVRQAMRASAAAGRAAADLDIAKRDESIDRTADLAGAAHAELLRVETEIKAELERFAGLS